MVEGVFVSVPKGLEMIPCMIGDERSETIEFIKLLRSTRLAKKILMTKGDCLFVKHHQLPLVWHTRNNNDNNRLRHKDQLY